MGTGSSLDRVAYLLMAKQLGKIGVDTYLPGKVRLDLEQLVQGLAASSNGDRKRLVKYIDLVISVLIRIRTVGTIETGETIETESTCGVRV